MTLIRPPSIHWINANAGSNGLVVASTFAGCGGSSTGYKWAGFEVRVACEFVPEAIECYRANAPKTKILEGDIRNVSAADLLHALDMGVGKLDVLDGSPPCQAFSTAGVRHKGWGKEKQYSGEIHQQSDDLFFEYVRLLDGVQPKVFVAENVRGLVSGLAQGYFKEIFRALEAAGPGYKVSARLLDGRQLGIPQKRTRLIFVGVRKDLGKEPAHPNPFPGPEPSIREAIADLPPPEEGMYEPIREGTRTREAWEKTDILVNEGCFRDTYLKLWGQNARYMWFRCPPHKPLPTVTAKVPCLTRWDVPRTFSIPEIKRAQSFPDDFVVTGNFKQQWERIGRAVPPAMMKAVAETVAKEIFGR